MSETKYRLLFETSVNPIFIASATAQLVDVNPAWLSLFGYSRKEALKKSLSDLFAEVKGYKQFWQKLSQDGSVNDFKDSFLKRDGSKTDCILTAATRRDEQGQLLGYQGIMRDITQQNKPSSN